MIGSVMIPILASTILAVIVLLSLHTIRTYRGRRVPRPFRRFPCIEELTAHGATISWITRKPSSGALELLRSGQNPQTIATKGIHTRHSVRVEKLKPDTVYPYAVAVDGELFRYDFSLKTCPLGNESSVGFFVLSDTGSARSPQYRVANRIQRLVTRGKVQFGLHAGDVSYSATATPDEDKEYFKPYRKILCKVPIWLAIGNHDAHHGKLRRHLEFHRMPANKRWYSFDYGPLHVIVLDSTVFRSKHQNEWLEQDLIENRERPWKIVLVHHPPYSWPYLYRGLPARGSHFPLRKKWCPLFEKHGVDVVFSGHSHTYQRSRCVKDFNPAGHGVHYIVCGGGGAPVHSVSDSLAEPGLMEKAVGNRYHFLFGAVERNEFVLRGTDARGRDFDRFSIQRNTGS